MKRIAVPTLAGLWLSSATTQDHAAGRAAILDATDQACAAVASGDSDDRRVMPRANDNPLPLALL